MVISSNFVPPSGAKSPFEFTGGKLCLDFANTVNNRTSDHAEELLTDYPSLVMPSSSVTQSIRCSLRLRDDNPCRARLSP